MLIDIFTIFPAYFDVLALSLLGKARQEGLLATQVHDLRAFTTDKHHTVDDTPYGGGAGMVMKPDVWGSALDSVLLAAQPEGTSPPLAAPVLVVPTPAGEPFTQATAGELATAQHLVFACGRYEGIDHRVLDHYRRHVQVREVSLGDYVLNGGEVAVLAMVEAIARLLPGMVGNPASIVEESFSQGLLEYPVFTKPASWRTLAVPPVLLSGDHARIARWRKDESLRRTATRRPDLLYQIDTRGLDSRDRDVLAGAGWATRATGLVPCEIRCAQPADAKDLADLASRTFPQACPPAIGPEDIVSHIAAELGEEQWQQRIADRAGGQVFVAQCGSQLVGYAWVKLPPTTNADPVDQAIASVITARPQVELSKIYVDADWYGSGIAGALFAASVARARHGGGAVLWLGTNTGNRAARKFYQRMGMRKVGSRVFYVGGARNDDVVFALPLV